MTAAETARRRKRARKEALDWEARNAHLMEQYREWLRASVQASVERVRDSLATFSKGQPLCLEVGRELGSYADWLQWTLWDLPWIAVALETDRDRFTRATGHCALTYLSLRMVDDVIDRHFLYRGQRETLLNRLSTQGSHERAANSLVYLGALLTCFEGLFGLLQDTDAETLQCVLRSLRRVTVGAMMELDERGPLNRSQYERMIELKNVDYSRILYAALDPEMSSPLAAFLERHYRFAQKINDLEDHVEDAARHQPNWVALHRQQGDGSDTGGWPPSLIEELLEEFEHISEFAAGLPDSLQGLGWLMIHRHYVACEALGFSFNEAAELPVATDQQPDNNLELSANIEEVLVHYGSAALEQLPCPICGQEPTRTFFFAQGFRIAQCENCRHTHVNPRLREGIQSQLAASHESVLDPFLTVQKIYAPHLVSQLLARTEGRRLLDIGPGRSYFLEQARAQGFEVYAVEPAPSILKHTWPTVGKRVTPGWLGADELPWKSFDVAVLSHVLEHVAWPVPALQALYRSLLPGGLVFIAVPDIESMQFRVLGRRWAAVAPLTHYHYFSEATLRSGLQKAGFIDCERVEPPAFPDPLAPRWMHLMRSLGGSDSGELRMLAWKPDLLHTQEESSAADDE